MRSNQHSGSRYLSARRGRRRATAILALTIAVALPLAGAAQGAQTPFTITDTIDFRTDATTFITTGPLCASGTYTDDVGPFATPAEPSIPHSSNNNHANVIIRTVFTCADGSGTFNALKHFRLAFTN